MGKKDKQDNEIMSQNRKTKLYLHLRQSLAPPGFLDSLTILVDWYSTAIQDVVQQLIKGVDFQRCGLGKSSQFN